MVGVKSELVENDWAQRCRSPATQRGEGAMLEGWGRDEEERLSEEEGGPATGGRTRKGLRGDESRKNPRTAPHLPTAACHPWSYPDGII